MSGVNKVIIVGRLGKDPELKTLDNGTMLARVPLATSESWNDKEGAKQEKTEWHNITFFGKQAETLCKYMKKGRELYVEGRLQTRTYEKDGETRYSTDIVGHTFTFIGGKAETTSDVHPGVPNMAPTMDANESLPF